MWPTTRGNMCFDRPSRSRWWLNKQNLSADRPQFTRFGSAGVVVHWCILYTRCMVQHNERHNILDHIRRSWSASLLFILILLSHLGGDNPHTLCMCLALLAKTPKCGTEREMKRQERDAMPRMAIQINRRTNCNFIVPKWVTEQKANIYFILIDIRDSNSYYRDHLLLLCRLWPPPALAQSAR